jgi:16S rRNA processing protein RimM
MKPQECFMIAQLGKAVGLHGDLKLHLHTDFPEQFKQGQKYQSDRGPLEIAEINLPQNLIRFLGFQSRESAQKLTNAKLFATMEQTQQDCELKEGEHFWFEVVGSRLVENDELIGVVTEILRMTHIDYLQIQTDSRLVQLGMPTSFLIPYIPRYIIQTDTAQKRILAKDAKEILEAS